MAGNAQLDTSGNPARLLISGDWTLAHYTRLKQQTEQLVGKYDAQTAINLDDQRKSACWLPQQELS